MGRWLCRCGRLLLRETVQCAEAERQIDSINADFRISGSR